MELLFHSLSPVGLTSIPSSLGINFSHTAAPLNQKRSAAFAEDLFQFKWAQQGSNLRPSDYESDALTN
jgi:hypothetical protein